MVKSQNGYPANPPRASRQVPGSKIKLVVANGPAGDLLLRFAAEFDRVVEDIDTALGGVLDDWGWADRPIRDGVELSNHASATAIDLNATRHVLGRVHTFTSLQVARIHDLLALFENVIRWGGDYTGRKDEMHFEINKPIGDVTRVLAKLNAAPAPVPGEDEDMLLAVEIGTQKVYGIYSGGVLTGLTGGGAVNASKRNPLWIDEVDWNELDRKSRKIVDDPAAKR